VRRLSDGRTISIPERERAITGVSNGEINRELAILKRTFNLAIQAGKLLHKPYIPLAGEDNTRTASSTRINFAASCASCRRRSSP
jgi:hypothetical protein